MVDLEAAARPDLAPLGSLSSWEAARIEDLKEEILRRAQRLAAIRSLGPDDFEAFTAAEWSRCRGVSEFDVEACLYWISQYGWMRAEKSPDETLRSIPFIPWEDSPDAWDLDGPVRARQESAIRFILERLRLQEGGLIPKSREVGITWLVLHVFLWLWIFHGCTLLLGSQKEDQVDRLGDPRSLFERLRWLLGRLPEWIRPAYNSAHMVLDNLDRPASITGDSTHVDFGRGGRYRLIFFDEAGTTTNAELRGILRSTESAGPLIIGYNPVGEHHVTYELFTEWDPARILLLPWETDPYRPEDFLESKIRPRGNLRREDALREWACSHEPIAEGLIFEWNGAIDFEEDDPEWVAVREQARAFWLHIGGWDFGVGKSYMVCLLALVQYDDVGDGLTLWIDQELVRQRVKTSDFADAVLDLMEPYGGPLWHLGDPAGIAKGQEQESYQDIIRGRGLTALQCLDAAYNDARSQELAIENIQAMIDARRLRIHRRCRKLREAMKHWSRKMPRGTSRLLDVPGFPIPLKNEHSHACMALIYMIDGLAILRQRQPRGQRISLAKELLQRGVGLQRGNAMATLRDFYPGAPMGKRLPA